jgi:uncharacterized protein (DUF362 family)
MGTSSAGAGGGVSRRGFLAGAGVGLIAGGALAGGAAFAWRRLWGEAGTGGSERPERFAGRSREVDRPGNAMPGRFPGRVIEVHHPGSVTADHRVSPEAVAAMIGRGMTGLTGADHPREAWASFFERGDVVGIKVNPVGYQRRPGVVGSISHPLVVLEVVRNLKSAGVHPRDIILFDRYASEFREAGYEALMGERDLSGCRWHACGSGFDPGQLDITGCDTRSQRRDRDPHVAGYDPDVFVHMGFAEPGHEDDERRFRSHLSLIVTRMVNKIVTIPVLKDHRSAGVTLALKNLSHGMNNNVARSHLGRVARLGGAGSGPNQCNTFIPTAAGQAPLRQKATLHILDGLIGVYEGGPGSWNPTWGTWRRQSMFFATDPVALDLVGWDVIDGRRAREGWPPVAQMGQLYQTPTDTLSAQLAALAASGPADLAALAAAGVMRPGNQETEQFDRRQPEHILLAGTIGLGVFDPRQLDYRRTTLDGSGRA